MAEYGAREFEVRERECLGCEAKFASYWFGNRLCSECGGCEQAPVASDLAYGLGKKEAERKRRRRASLNCAKSPTPGRVES